jgi:hypothetical protein
MDHQNISHYSKLDLKPSLNILLKSVHPKYIIADLVFYQVHSQKAQPELMKLREPV